jgi:hypothetical protein
MWLDKPIRMSGTNQFDINTCHHNNKLDQILNHLHLFGNFSKSPINEYSDQVIIIWSDVVHMTEFMGTNINSV